MNKLITLIMLFGLITNLSSCDKNKDSDNDTVILNETIRVNSSYQTELGNFGDEEGASIATEALHASVSTIERNGSKVIYKYVPVANFAGTDEVRIKSARGSDGASANNNITYTLIKFTIIN